MFNRSVDTKLAQSIVDALSTPDSPLFQILLNYAEKPNVLGLPVPQKSLVSGLEAEFARLGLNDGNER